MSCTSSAGKARRERGRWGRFGPCGTTVIRPAHLVSAASQIRSVPVEACHYRHRSAHGAADMRQRTSRWRRAAARAAGSRPKSRADGQGPAEGCRPRPGRPDPDRRDARCSDAIAGSRRRRLPPAAGESPPRPSQRSHRMQCVRQRIRDDRQCRVCRLRPDVRPVDSGGRRCRSSCESTHSECPRAGRPSTGACAPPLRCRPAPPAETSRALMTAGAGAVVAVAVGDGCATVVGVAPGDVEPSPVVRSTTIQPIRPAARATATTAPRRTPLNPTHRATRPGIRACAIRDEVYCSHLSTLGFPMSRSRERALLRRRRSDVIADARCRLPAFALAALPVGVLPGIRGFRRRRRHRRPR